MASLPGLGGRHADPNRSGDSQRQLCNGALSGGLGRSLRDHRWP